MMMVETMASPEEGNILLTVARTTLEGHFQGKSVQAPKNIPPSLQQKRGTFVTLHLEGNLRGCIGRVEPQAPLLETVSEMALEAALRDPRFPPLTKEELPRVLLEISILSPLKRITDPQDIEIGKHGLLIRKEGAAGLLLPQVPKEHGWTKKEFLMQTCHKAGLPDNAWKEEGTHLYIFTTEIYSEGAYG